MDKLGGPGLEMPASIPVHVIETRFFERGGEFVLIAYVDDPRVDTLRDLPRMEVLNSDRIYLVSPSRTVEVDRRLVEKMFPLRFDDAVTRSRWNLEREYGVGTVEDALAVRIPRKSIVEFNADDTRAVKEKFKAGKGPYADAPSVLLVADGDHIRLNPYKFWAEVLAESIASGLTRAEMARWAWKRLRGRGWSRGAEVADACGVVHEVDLVKRRPRAALRCYPEAGNLESFSLLAGGLGLVEALAVVAEGDLRGQGPVRAVRLKDL